jgi:MauM/NapG family ferredoxin protein
LPWWRLRLISQWIFLALFFTLFILTAYKGADEIAYPVRVFLRFDPLILITTVLSSRVVPVALLLALITCSFTLVFGRVFCGWVCPLGTLNDFMGHFTPKRQRKEQRAGRTHRLKYYILIFILASSLFTLQIAGLADPISLLIRSLAVAVEPALNLMVNTVFDLLYRAHIPGVTTVSEAVYAFLKNYLLSFRQPFFYQGFFISLIFAGVLLANLYRRRFWCTVLCPLGALLGLITRISPLKRVVDKGCTSCNICVRECRTGAATDLKGEWKKAECVVCGECDEDCPEDVVRFGFLPAKGGSTGGKVAGIDLGRRGVIASLVAGIFIPPLIRTSPITQRRAGRLIRPPGALPEDQFLRRCVRCGECMKVCLTNGLQPALLEAGLEGIWTPRFDFRTGYCQYYCTLCGQVCPTGAIKKLSQAEKARIKIGLAYIDKNRCIPYVRGNECLVCEEHCPTPDKAIKFEQVQTLTPGGRKLIKRPVIDLKLCIGCGICEYKCPLHDQPAIIVTRLGESRADELLPF